jgi:hypothetical protein
MDPNDLSEASEAEPEPSYAELARRLLAERAELFRITPPRRAEPESSAPALAPRLRGAVRRGPQLPLPLRPHVINGGRKGSR